MSDNVPCPRCGDPCAGVMESYPGQYYCKNDHGWGMVSQHLHMGGIDADDVVCPTCQSRALTVWWEEDGRHFKCGNGHAWMMKKKEEED